MTAVARGSSAGASAAGEPEGPPVHVRTAFGVRDSVPRPRPHLPGPAWSCDGVLLRPVSDTVLAAWSAATLEELAGGGVDGIRLARPVRASDGRRVVSGWSACHDVAGEVRPRHDDVVAVSLRLHRATARLSRPRLVDDRDDILARADRAAFGEKTVPLDPETGGDLFAELARRRVSSTLPLQLVHGDLFGTVLFEGAGAGEDATPPAVLDLVPFWRPVEWAAAVVVVDALAWGGADAGIVGRWSHLQAWPQMLLHGLLFRLAVHAQHPACTKESLRGLEHAARVITELL
ncbi:TIGR02569 family protein [Actinomycetospora corticicola]|uniref:TIGR02569 family protein n=1 Tax=Actinomycetospora corticicola TaxID=663602 RepID=UPI0015CB7305|nr:TIGR02569 family protein [Actinomycetospora corticicola]